MRNFECYEYCDYGPIAKSANHLKHLFGYSEPVDDYFNDNLDQYYEEDDYFDYTDHPEDKFSLEDKEYTYSHIPAHLD